MTIKLVAAWGSSLNSLSAGSIGVDRNTPVDGSSGGGALPMISAITLLPGGASSVTSEAGLALPDQSSLAFLGSGVGPSLVEGGGLGMSPATMLGVSTGADCRGRCCIHLGLSLDIVRLDIFRLAHMLLLPSSLEHESCRWLMV